MMCMLLIRFEIGTNDSSHPDGDWFQFAVWGRWPVVCPVLPRLMATLLSYRPQEKSHLLFFFWSFKCREMGTTNMGTGASSLIRSSLSVPSLAQACQLSTRFCWSDVHFTWTVQHQPCTPASASRHQPVLSLSAPHTYPWICASESHWIPSHPFWKETTCLCL